MLPMSGQGRHGSGRTEALAGGVSVVPGLRRCLRVLAGGAPLLLIAACAGSRWDGYRISPPALTGYEETGNASWYGRAHHGSRTASGEIYNMRQMTAAHRSLPFGTWVRIENLENGRTARVRINDRGPVLEGRILDLSDAAAHVLGAKGLGVIPIRLRVIRVPEGNEGEPEAAGPVR